MVSARLARRGLSMIVGITCAHWCDHPYLAGNGQKHPQNWPFQRCFWGGFGRPEGGATGEAEGGSPGPLAESDALGRSENITSRSLESALCLALRMVCGSTPRRAAACSTDMS